MSSTSPERRRPSNDDSTASLGAASASSRKDSSSSRFQVSRTTIGDPLPSVASPDAMIGDTLDVPSEANSPIRKVSSTGRFKVVTNPDGVDPRTSRAETEPPSLISDTATTRQVHFSLDEKLPDVLHPETAVGFGETLKDVKSWRHCLTLEHPPIIDFYRNTLSPESGHINTRPSMLELLTGEKSTIDMQKDIQAVDDAYGKDKISPNEPSDSATPRDISVARTKFGWIEGVFFRCLLNIFGVMLYLRISWVAGQAGLIMGTLVVLLASLVTTLTALSTCAICTNGDVKGGGAYFLISRSLGPDFGGSIGIIFSVANAVGAAMYVVGFAETLRDLLLDHGLVIFDGGLNDVRLIGLVTCILLMGIVFIGTGFESKMQMGLLVILTLSILDYFIGTFLPVSDEQRIKGITGYSMATAKENLLPNFRDGYSFFTVFSIYFPAATGIMAGANISGDLADPQKAIPKGTLTAIALTTVVYIMTIWSTGTTCVRDADGFSTPQLIDPVNVTSIFESYIAPACAANSSCKYGLMNYFQVMESEALWGPLITAGIFAATLSSALASLVSAPKIFQAVCRDRLFPYIDFFSKSSGKDEEPRRAYILGFVVSMVMICIGDLNAIAPIISNFFLCSYALINYACFDNSFADSPGFRPAFKYYNMWISLIGGILCLFVMFIVSWFTALLTFVFFFILFLYISKRAPEVNWGSSAQAHNYRAALSSITRLDYTNEHVKNFRPQLLILTGNPVTRSLLVDFAYNITKGHSLMVCGYVIPHVLTDSVFGSMRTLNYKMRIWFQRRKVKAFYVSVANPSLRTGTQALLQVTGLGRLRPNIVLIGFKHNWAKQGLSGMDAVNDYFGVVLDAFASNLSVMILRNAEHGLDFNDVIMSHCNNQKFFFDNEDGGSTDGIHNQSERDVLLSEKTDDGEVSHSSERPVDLMEAQYALTYINGLLDDEEAERLANGEVVNDSSTNSFDDLQPSNGTSMLPDDDLENGGGDHGRLTLLRRRSTRRLTEEQKKLLTTMSSFQCKAKNGIIDVWWLYDDGGLTLLIPYLLTQPKSYLENASLRVYTASTSRNVEDDMRNMAALLRKFRIAFSNVTVIPDISRKPQPATLAEFDTLTAPFRCASVESENYVEGMIVDAELSTQRDKHFRMLRTSELIRQHSSNADLVVVTLPVPRKGFVASCLYLAWLDMVTRSGRPTLLIRGNQTSVLTFYS